jgi:hypothetical protein
MLPARSSTGGGAGSDRDDDETGAGPAGRRRTGVTAG